MIKLTVQMAPLLKPSIGWSHRCLYRPVVTKTANHKSSGQFHWDHRKADSRLEKSELMNEHRSPTWPGTLAQHRLDDS